MREPRRIVSLLPSATETCFALGVGDRLVGRTFECDHPAAAADVPVVSTTTMPAEVSAGGPAAIDAWVSDAMRRGEDLYHLDADALRALDPDLVLTQDLCAVCAVAVGTVEAALVHLGTTADVLTLDPHTVEEVLTSITAVAERVGAAAVGADLVTALRARLADVRRRVAGRPRPRVAVLEWTDPPFAPGHWLPEQVALAGGEPVLGRTGERSVRTTWEAVAASRPDVVVSAPCGYGLDGARRLAEDVLPLLPDVPVWAVDADGFFARPGPRVVDGVAVLAGLLHPDAGVEAPEGSAVRVGRGTRAGPAA